ncbi:hypothetical protein [Marinobacter sp. ELB17]|uniref:hypothetical protein n=1 Tax=Marinobacter sp. ELB17 TaxID=270374 RepID=UPI0000F388C1|nr:hypothetical protein [Marinobacter sp. ELB17]EAZ97347.1 hypothetical protein MELB17_09423 [Marinobacter sp. ELB17]
MTTATLNTAIAAVLTQAHIAALLDMANLGMADRAEYLESQHAVADDYSEEDLADGHATLGLASQAASILSDLVLIDPLAASPLATVPLKALTTISAKDHALETFRLTQGLPARSAKELLADGDNLDAYQTLWLHQFIEI